MTKQERSVNQCRSARKGLTFYRIRTSHWKILRGVESEVRIHQPRGCAHVRWLASEWKSRAWRARQAYHAWISRYYTLRPHRDWQRAVREVQRAYPGTQSWLLSCSASEGAHGLWVPNRQGSGAGGWLQFMESTFWRMYGSALSDVTARGFDVPTSAASWYSPLGQALAGAWGVTNGRSHEWYGHGCRT